MKPPENEMVAVTEKPFHGGGRIKILDMQLLKISKNDILSIVAAPVNVSMLLFCNSTIKHKYRNRYCFLKTLIEEIILG